MAIFEAILGSILPAVAGKIFGGGSSAAGQSGGTIAGAAGVGGMPNPQQPSSNPSGGSLLPKLMRDAFEKGVGSIINMPLDRMAARNQGAMNRDYLSSSFPELNPWELAGAQATQSGVQVGQQQLQEKLQSKELSTRERMQDKVLNVERERIAAGLTQAEISAGATTGAATITSGPAYALIEANRALTEAEADLTRTRETNEIVQTDIRAIESTRHVLERAYREHQSYGEVTPYTSNQLKAVMTAEIGSAVGKAVAAFAGAVGIARGMKGKGVSIEPKANQSNTRAANPQFKSSRSSVVE